MQISKRILALLLTVVMVASMLPMTAGAEEAESFSAEKSAELLAAAQNVDLTEATEAEEENEEQQQTPADPVVIAECDVHTPEVIPAVDPTCHTFGYTAGVKCSVCNKVITSPEKLPMTKHTLATQPAKNPTWTTPGWAAFEYCTVDGCAYSTQASIPALGEPTIDNYMDFMTNLYYLEVLAGQYVQTRPGKDPAELVIKYIRTGVDRYNSGSWQIMAGYEDTEFARFVRLTEDEMNQQMPSVDQYLKITGLRNVVNFNLPDGTRTDFGHMFGTMDISYFNKSSQNHADVAGWAGDLVDLLSCADLHRITGSVEELTKTISDNYLMGGCNHGDAFGPTDMYGDLDGMYLFDWLMANEYTPGALSQVMYSYFTTDLTLAKRCEYFLDARLEGVGTQSNIRQAVYEAYMGNKMISTLENTREWNTSDLSDLRKAVCNAFADLMWKLGGDYVELVENPYYEIFQSTDTVLAPGITQEINYAQSSDGKQMVFYIATIDLPREDVEVYANYKDNDPTEWGMQRVLEQAQAAQNKYGDPNSPDYIKNYNVIASINADGFAMTSTGAPSGLLVMNGVEYNPINRNGFFGITKDGQAIIGTTEEYNTIYKDIMRDAIGGFGTTLIENGKINVKHSANYTSSRASRTAVGITRSGKVVFMVLDGRQEPFSCGGSMEEIAQIMLEAGCVKAINLDGGGSSTFVSKQEGQDTLSVINRPSDGYERSVGPTLFAVSTAPSSTAFDHAVIESEYTVSTIGTPVQLTAKGVSATGNAAELPEGTTWRLSNTRWGTITEDGVFTGSRNGNVTVYLMLGDETLGQITLRVANPTGLYFDRTSVDAVYGQTVEIPVIATYDGKKVAVQDSDLKFTVNKTAAGSFNGRMFTAKESNLTMATVTVALAKNSGVTATINVNLYRQGENSFDFENATSGDRQLAFDREVTNATTEDGSFFTVVDPTKPMETHYIFAMDMSQMTIPERLADLTYMLPGADQVGSNAWGFLLQLAQRVSDMSYVTTTLKFDPRFDVDISELKVIAKYFEVTEVTLDKETNTAFLKLNWIRQSQAIDPSTANSLCIVNGIKLTPKADADWGVNNQINAVHTGEISYRIYLRASALVSFGSKPENQQIYGLYSYQNPNMPSDAGAYFENKYKDISDSYSLRSTAKTGWQVEDGGYVYYVDGQRLTGVQQIDGYYYDFGETGINQGQTKYTGLLHQNGKIYYSLLGQLTSGWVAMENGDYYHFNINTYAAMTGVTKVGAHTYTFSADGVLLRGAFVEDSKGLHYYWAGRKANRQWVHLEEGSYYADSEGNIAFGHAMVKEDATKPIVWWHFDETTGLATGKSDGFITSEGKLYYCEDGVHFSGAKTVDGGIIFCGTYGLVYTNSSCYVMDTSRGDTNLQTGFYATDSKGMIIADGFVNASGNTYYFTDYVRATGLTKIGDKYYLFNSGNGAMYKDSVQWVGANSYGVEPGYYTFLADGAMFVPDLVNGVKKIVEKDGQLYFTSDGVILKSGLYELDGEYYHADFKGVLTRNATIWESFGADLPSGNGYYSFDADGKLIKTGFVTGGDQTFYYRDLVRVKGFTKIGDDYYLFNSGYGNMIAGRTEWVGANPYGIAPGYYTFLADGKMFVPDLVNGEKKIVEKDGNLYFTIDGVTLKSGLYELDGEYYYASGNGALLRNTSYWVTTTELPAGSGYYSFGADGKLIKTGFVTGGGNTFYYRDLVRVKGFTKIGDDYYLFNAGYGNMIMGRTEWVSKNDYGVAAGYYTFLADGKMFVPDLVNGKKEIVERSGNLYFTIDGVTLKSGLYELDGEYYYASGNGALLRNTAYWITTTELPAGSGYYSFGADGKLIKTGFVTGGGNTFYYRDLVRVKGFTKIGDDYYLFNAGYGNMIAGRNEWVGKNEYGIAAGTYTFLADGKMFVPDLVNGEKKIVEKDGNLYFTIDGVTLKNGLYELDGEYYYASGNGALLRNTTYWVTTTELPSGSGYYSFGADGKLIKTGFVTGGGNTFYYRDLVRVKGFTKIGDSYYLFNAGSGEMVKGRTEWVGKNEYGIAAGTYTFLSDGKMFVPDLVNGEKKIVEKDGNLYFTIDGVTLKNGLYELDGEYYYASGNGALLRNTTYWITTDILPAGSGYYSFDAQGKLVKTGFASGDGKTFYYRDLERVKGFTKIGEDFYLFNASSGEMVKGRTEWVGKNEYGIAAGTYTFLADGKMFIPDLVNGEKKIVEKDGNLYFTIDGVTLKSGLYELDGEYYYASSNGALLRNTSYWVTTTELPAGSGYYSFGADGKLIKTGFASGSGKTYYYRDLVRVKGFTKIGEDFYLFNAGSGEMVKGRNEWVGANEYGIAAGTYAFAADGKLILN